MDELEKYHISQMFSHPVDPIGDNCPNYFDMIHNPMDLGTTRHKLESDQYSSVEQWRADVELVWTNALTYYGNKSLLSVLAKQLQSHFREITAFLSPDVEADWNAKFEKLKTELQGVVKTVPKAPLASRIGRPPSATRSSIAPAPMKAPERFGKGGGPEKAPGMATEEITKLADDVNLVEQPDQVDQIIDLIRTMEPNFLPSDTEDEIELEVSTLEPATLLELRVLVTRLLGR
jgi:hypothetical protein